MAEVKTTKSVGRPKGTRVDIKVHAGNKYPPEVLPNQTIIFKVTQEECKAAGALHNIPAGIDIKVPEGFHIVVTGSNVAGPCVLEGTMLDVKIPLQAHHTYNLRVFEGEPLAYGRLVQNETLWLKEVEEISVSTKK